MGFIRTSDLVHCILYATSVNSVLGRVAGSSGAFAMPGFVASAIRRR